MFALLKKQRILPPPKYRKLYRDFKGKRFAFLDVGCGNHSPSQAKKWFPNCEYHGIDREDYNNSADDKAKMNAYYELDLELSDLSQIPDGYFDLIVMSHVVEHLRNGEEVLPRLCKKLKPGGRFYIEFPSPRSLSFRNMRGTLNFCDDDTHVRVYDFKEVSNYMLSNGMKVHRAGIKRDPWRIVLFPLFLLEGWMKGSPAGAFWDLYGFAEFVYAIKK